MRQLHDKQNRAETAQWQRESKRLSKRNAQLPPYWCVFLYIQKAALRQGCCPLEAVRHV